MDDSGEPRGAQSTIWPEIAVTADVLVLARREEAAEEKPEGAGGEEASLAERFEILLIKRKYPPCEGSWALPGGGVEMDEDLEDAARRELLEETGISAGTLAQLRAYGKPGRDPRARVVSIAFWTVVERSEAKGNAGSDAVETAWFPLTGLPELAFDHSEMIGDATRLLFGESE